MVNRVGDVAMPLFSVMSLIVVLSSMGLPGLNGILPSGWFSLMDTTVASLVNDLGAGVLTTVH